MRKKSFEMPWQISPQSNLIRTKFETAVLLTRMKLFFIEDPIDSPKWTCHEFVELRMPTQATSISHPGQTLTAQQRWLCQPALWSIEYLLTLVGGDQSWNSATGGGASLMQVVPSGVRNLVEEVSKSLLCLVRVYGSHQGFAYVTPVATQPVASTSFDWQFM